MEQDEGLKLASNESPADVGVFVPSPRSRGETNGPRQPEVGSCPTYGRLDTPTPPSYVYALGKIVPRFPTIGVEKEFAQATGQAATAGLTDSQTLYEVLRQRRYLVRQLCWVFTIEGLETYILYPRDPVDFDLLAEALRQNPGPMDVDAVIGVRGPIAPPEMCNGLMVPIVGFDQLYSFDRASLLASIPKPENVSEEQFKASAEQLFDRIVQISDNAGSTDEHRALNYLAVRYHRIYEVTYDAFQRNSSLSGVVVTLSRLSGTRKIVDAIFSYTHRQTSVIEKHFVRVDVTEEFPFLVTALSPYFDR